MKAFVRTSAQNKNVELAEVPIPEIDDQEILVNIKAFGVGIHDRYFIPGDVEFPFPIGSEAAGVITKIGSQITDSEIGDRVILSSLLLPKGGCWAEYVAVPSRMIIFLPDEIPFLQGAAIPIAGKTALEIMRALDLEEGDTLFAAGASGAIGTLIIQLASARGIRVAGSASPKNHEYMLSLGAETAVDYHDSDWQKEVKEWMPNGVDAALAIQPGTAKDSMEVVKTGGKVITVSGDSDSVSPERNITVRQFQHQLDLQKALKKIVEEITEGNIQLVIEDVYPFAQAIDALEKTETRHARGKSVVSVAEG